MTTAVGTFAEDDGGGAKGGGGATLTLVGGGSNVSPPNKSTTGVEAETGASAVVEVPPQTKSPTGAGGRGGGGAWCPSTSVGGASCAWGGASRMGVVPAPRISSAVGDGEADRPAKASRVGRLSVSAAWGCSEAERDPG